MTAFEWPAVDPRGQSTDSLVRLLNTRLSKLARAVSAKQGSIGWFDVTMFGARGDGVTDDRAAIVKAYAAAAAAGGGVVYYPPGEYLLTATQTVSVPVPVSGTNYATASQSIAAHIYLANPTGIVSWMHGATLRSSKTDGGTMFLFDGPRDCAWIGGLLQSPTTVGGGFVTTVGVGAIAVTSTTRDGIGVTLDHVRCSNVYSAFYCFGDAASSFRVRDIQIRALWHDIGEYCVALHNNGINVDYQIHTSSIGRQFFHYGCDRVQGQVYAVNTLGGFQSLLKAYDADTTNIDIAISVAMPNTQAKVEFASEHHPATQPTPKSIRNVRLTFDDRASAGGRSLLWRYLQDGVDQATCSTMLFDNFEIMGQAIGTIDAFVQMTGTQGTLDVNGLITTTGKPDTAIYAAGGFRSRAYFSTNQLVGNSPNQFWLGGVHGTIASIIGLNGGAQLVVNADQFRLFDKTSGTEFLNVDSTRALSNGHVDLASGKVYKVNGTQVVAARETGWTLLSGTADKSTSWDTSTVTLGQLAQRVAALERALANSHGLIGT